METRSAARDRKKEEEIPLLERVRVSLAVTASRLEMEEAQALGEKNTEKQKPEKTSPCDSRQARTEKKTQALINRDGSLGRRKSVEEHKGASSSGVGGKGGGAMGGQGSGVGGGGRGGGKGGWTGRGGVQTQGP